MAQIIKHRRGTLAELNGVTLNNGELGIVTSSVASIGDAVLKTAVVVGNTDGTNRLSIGRITRGNATPDLSGVTGGSAFNDMLYHETDAKTLKVLNTGGNVSLDLTGNIADREVGGTLDVTGRVDAQAGLQVTGSLNVSGDGTFGGNLTFGDADTDLVSFGADIGSNLIPNADDTYDLGSATQAWQDLYLEGDIHLTDAGSVATDAGALTIDGAGGINIGTTSDQAIDVDSSTFDLDASSTIHLSGSSVTLDGSGVSIEGNASEVDITTTGTVDINSAAFDLDASGAITIDGTSTIGIGSTAAAGAINIGTNATAREVTIGSNTGVGGITMVTGTGGIDVDAQGDITIDAGTTSAISLDASAASNFTTSAGALTLTSAAAATWSTSAGALVIDGAGGLTLDSDGTDAVNLGTEAVAKTITIGNAASTKVDINALALDFDSAAATDILAATTVSVKGATGASIGDDTGTWEFDGLGALSETGMTTFSLTPSGVTDIDAGDAVTIDSSETISIGGDSVGRKITVGGDTGTRTEVELNAILVDINAGTSGVTIDAGATSNFTTSAGDIDINAAANLDLDGATVDIDSAAALSLQAAAASDFTTSAGALTLEGFTGINFKESGSDVIAIDTNRDVLFSHTGGSTSDPDVEFDGYVRHDGQVEVTDTTDSTSITTGALVVDGGVGIAKDLVVGGMVTAQEFHTEFVSASIMYSSGSTKFGDTIDDIHSFTGSINQSGSFNLNDGNMTITDTLTATNIGAFTSTGAIDFDSQDMTNVDIDSGAIDGVTIGGASAGAITGTTIDATTDFTIDGLVITADDITNDAGLEIQTAAGDITLDPGGNNVLPGSDSADDLGASGTAWNKLWVDAIELNAQGSVTNAVSASIGYISGSGNMKIDGAATFGGGYGSTGTTISSAGVIQSNGNIETAGSFVIGSADMNETDLEKLDGITDGTAAANKALVLDASSDISSGINDFQVSKLEIDSANDYLEVDTDLKVIASADIVLNPGGNNVKPGGDSEDDLGVSGTAWRTLYVDSIKMNGQGSIDGATHITGSGNLEISGNISGSINTTGSFSDLMAVGAGASVAASSASLVSFRNNANSQFGYLASADTQAITTGIVGYNTSTGNLTISSVIDGGSF